MVDDRNSPATKGDVADLKDELVEAIRDSQTEVLKAFYRFSHTVQDRFKESDDSEAAIKRRMTTLESRVLEVEKRLNLPFHHRLSRGRRTTMLHVQVRGGLGDRRNNLEKPLRET